MARSPAERTRRLVEDARGLFLAGGKAPEGKLEARAQRVLGDLARFCVVDRPAVVMDREGRVDAMALAVMEGRRQAFLRLTAPLNLSPLALQKLAALAKEMD